MRSLKLVMQFLLLGYNLTLQSHNQSDEDDLFNKQMQYNFIQNSNYLSLFNADTVQSLPYQRLLQGMLEGVHPYQLVSIDDNPISPYAIIKSASNYIYLIGNPHQEQLDQILQIFAQFQHLLLICNESLQGYFIQHGFTIHPRIEFAYQCDSSLSYKQVPTGYHIEKLDMNLLKKSPWCTFIGLMYGSKQNFLDMSFGFALLNTDNVPVAFAYGVFIGNGSCEIAVITPEDHRGNGYIVYPATALIEEILNRNLEPVWNCDSDNTASLKTALKLNFKIKQHYTFLQK